MKRTYIIRIILLYNLFISIGLCILSNRKLSFPLYCFIFLLYILSIIINHTYNIILLLILILLIIISYYLSYKSKYTN